MKKKKIITISAIRPDFIRMSAIFKALDKKFDHILIHTGQHFDFNLSDIFFSDLSIRKPDYNWSIGKTSADHLDQLANIATNIKKHQDLIKSADLVLFLGDSNSVLASIPIAKMGVKVGHIEAGMRSYDKRMLEEINRVACDHCSNIHFCYHSNYAKNLWEEGVDPNKTHVVGNTITEVVKKMVPTDIKRNDSILADIHRPENFLYPERLKNIIKYLQDIGEKYNLPVRFLKFSRTMDAIKINSINTDKIDFIDLMSFPDYIKTAYHSRLVMSDSGTAQEELAYLRTPVLVPRDFTERPESIENECSVMLNVNSYDSNVLELKLAICEYLTFDTEWLGNGNTSQCIVDIIEKYLNYD